MKTSQVTLQREYQYLQILIMSIQDIQEEMATLKLMMHVHN